VSIDPIPSPKLRTVWAVATSRQVYERIRAIAIARQTSNAKVVAMALDAFENPEPRKETRNA
jgi:RPA family protein